MSRVAVFIDNSNVFKRLEELNRIDANWVKSYNPRTLSKKLSGARELVTIQFYCSPPPTHLFKDRPKVYWQQVSYYEAVKKLKGVEVKYGELKGFGKSLVEKNLDTQMTADIVVMAYENKYDTAIVVSNDGDFQSAVQKAKGVGKKVEVAYFKGYVSMGLKQYADISRRLRQSYFEELPFEVNRKSGR